MSDATTVTVSAGRSWLHGVIVFFNFVEKHGKVLEPLLHHAEKLGCNSKNL